MFTYSVLDPRSFAIPVGLSALIVSSIFVLMSTQWVDTTEHVVRVPKHISAKLVTVNKPKPKTVKQPVKKTVKKQVKKQPVKKVAPAKKVIPAKVDKPKPAQVQKEKPKPLPLPGADLTKALQEEEQMMNMQELLDAEMAAQQAEKDMEAIASFESQISELFKRIWSYPPSSKHTDEVLIRISLVPTGEVTDVHIVRSSGNVALDRSAEQAVWKAGKLPVPDDLMLFEKNFRQFNFLFRPEEARL